MNDPLMPLSFTRTLRLKVRAESYPWLNEAKTEVNRVWNACNDYGEQAWERRNRGESPKPLSGFDLCNLMSGWTEFTDRIGADTIQRVCCEFAVKRKAAKKFWLTTRRTGGRKRSLGWIPFKAASLKRRGNVLRFAGKSFRVFDREYLADHKFRDGCFAQDACGDWWLCVPVGIKQEHSAAPGEAVGIDLGLKDIAVTSDGERLEAGRWTHSFAEKLARAQRRGHKQQVKRIHRKAARCRADALHKFSRKLVDRYQMIFVGDVSSTKLVKTRMAKSVLDSGWGMLKTQLQYKGEYAGRSVEVVSERNTSRVCSSCGCASGPSGLRQLAVRAWRCVECGDTHDRDVNAARNILLLGSRCLTSVRGNESLQLTHPPSSASRARKAGIGAANAAA